MDKRNALAVFGISSFVLLALIYLGFKVSYILALMFIIVWVFIFWLRVTLLKHRRGLWLHTLNFIILYAMLNVFVVCEGMYLQRKLAQFDTNRDGVFSKEERTSEQQDYMNSVTNDLGRNLIPITGIAYSMISTLLLGLVLKADNLARKKEHT